jgi:hypothetical protein
MGGEYMVMGPEVISKLLVNAVVSWPHLTEIVVHTTS